MIPDAEGATPIGIYFLGHTFLVAARAATQTRPKLTDGPARLLAYHACELFLKAFLRKHGEGIGQLRAYGHYLEAMVASAKDHGLALPAEVVVQLETAVRKKDYVRVRYMVSEERTDIAGAKVIRMARRLGITVANALGVEWIDPEGGIGSLPRQAQIGDEGAQLRAVGEAELGVDGFER